MSVITPSYDQCITEADKHIIQWKCAEATEAFIQEATVELTHKGFAFPSKQRNDGDKAF